MRVQETQQLAHESRTAAEEEHNKVQSEIEHLTHAIQSFQHSLAQAGIALPQQSTQAGASG